LAFSDLGGGEEAMWGCLFVFVFVFFFFLRERKVTDTFPNASPPTVLILQLPQSWYSSRVRRWAQL